MTTADQGAEGLRIALFSGNYNYVRDGANQALNRLVDYAQAQGASVRVYAPTIAQPAIAPNTTIIDVPAIPFPFGRAEYRFTRGLSEAIRADIRAFAPDVFHVSAPDVLNHRAVTMAREAGIPIVASAHTLFETYPAYYHMGFLEAPLTALLRRFYNRVNMVMPPSEVIIRRMQGQGITTPMRVWSRGVDHKRFNPARRDLAWRQSLGIGDEELVIGFLGRLVLEKGLGIFGQVSQALTAMGVPHRVLVIGDGPAREKFQAMVPHAVVAGFQTGDDLGRAVASLDLLLNPSVTETFGNVTLEALASGVPVVAADATGNQALVTDGVTGRLVAPTDPNAYAQAIAAYAKDRALLAAASQAGQAFAADFVWDRITQSVLDTYRDVIRNPANPGGV